LTTADEVNFTSERWLLMNRPTFLPLPPGPPGFTVIAHLYSLVPSLFVLWAEYYNCALNTSMVYHYRIISYHIQSSTTLKSDRVVSIKL